jgi:hypothetical protein
LAYVPKDPSVAPQARSKARVYVADEPKGDIGAVCLEVALAVVLSKALFGFLRS